MKQRIEKLQTEAKEALQEASSEEELEQARTTYLGRKGELRQIMSAIGDLPQEQRPQVGRLFNRVQSELEALLEQRQQELQEQSRQQQLSQEKLDVTLPGRTVRAGHRHPLMAAIDDTVAIFLGLGFAVAEGPQVETSYYAFEALNYPPDHPAMDEQMTFYVTDDVVLRSQTSTVQIRVMEQEEPPVRVVVPGRCFRRDTVDATHCHTFHQLEGLLVDEGITMADLRGTLEAFAHGMYGPECGVRFRPDFFPFTEPSAELALSCMVCGGEGCRVCDNSGYVEIGGCGMVDPNVLENVGYDSEKYTGFAFGFGLERIAMMRHGIDDIRLLFSGDMRFLNQF